MARKEQWVVDFFNLHGFYPMAGGDGTGGDAPAAAAPGGAAPAAAAPSGSAQVPSGGGGPAAEPQKFPEINTLIPSEYKDKPWVKETKDVPTLFKRMDDLVVQIGKKTVGIPGENAKPEEVAAFNKAFGVPEKAEDYKFGEPPAGLTVDAEFQTAVKAMFHKHGVSTKQAAGLEKDWNELQLQMVKKAGPTKDQATLDAEFDALTNETFGKDKDEVLLKSNYLIGKYAPSKFADHIKGLDNKTLLILGSVINGIRKEFISEDHFPKGGGTPVGMTNDQKRAEGQRLMGTKAYMDPFDPEHEATKKKVQELYGTA